MGKPRRKGSAIYNIVTNRFEQAPRWYRLGGWIWYEPYARIRGWMWIWDYRFRLRYQDRRCSPAIQALSFHRDAFSFAYEDKAWQ